MVVTSIIAHIVILQLKVYMHESSIYPRITGDDVPMAVDNETLMDALRKVSRSDLLPASNRLTLSVCPIVAAVLVFILIIIILATYVNGGNLHKRAKIKLSNQAKASILSISFVSLSRILSFILMDSAAIHNRNRHWDKEVEDIYHPGNTGSLNDIMFHVPDELLAFDVSACVFHIIIVFIAICFKKKWPWCCANIIANNNFKDLHYYFLSLTALCFILSSLMHAPYIAMAYLSDPHYASSIFIYYMMILFIEFGLLQYIFNTCFNRIQCSFKIVMCLAIMSWFVLYSLIITVSFFFYYVPIKNLLSNAPNEAVLVYQSALVLAGAYITYKAIFEKVKDPEKALIIDRQMKTNEISLLENEITMQHNDQTKTFLRSRINHLHKEIQLNFLHSKVIHLASEPEGQLINQIEIIQLHRQQNEIVKYLNLEVEHLRRALQDHEEIFNEVIAEIICLENAILSHYRRSVDQLCGEPNKRDDVNEVQQEILALQWAIHNDLQSKLGHLNENDNRKERENIQHEIDLLEDMDPNKPKQP